MTIIGIDCATLASKTGLAFAEYNNGRLQVQECMIGNTSTPIAQQVADWLKPSTTALLALDSPLGWPALLGTNLAAHKAGVSINVKSNDLFRRHTDEVVREALGKSPLEVGADRIARTAIAALSLRQTWVSSLEKTLSSHGKPSSTRVFAPLKCIRRGRSGHINE